MEESEILWQDQISENIAFIMSCVTNVAEDSSSENIAFYNSVLYTQLLRECSRSSLVQIFTEALANEKTYSTRVLYEMYYILR